MKKQLLLLLFPLALLVSCRQADDLNFNRSPEALLQHLGQNAYLVSFDAVKAGAYQLIDLRPPAAYEAGHLADAVNIPLPNLLEEETRKMLGNQSVNFVLYGATPAEAAGPYMLLYRMGYDNIRVLQEPFEAATGTVTAGYTPGLARQDYNVLYTEAIERHQKELEATKFKPPPPVKKIEVKPKKKPAVEEEGC